MAMEENQNLLDSDESSSSQITAATADSCGMKHQRCGNTISKRTTDEICKTLLKCIKEDKLAVDAKWNLFIAACQSYRYDSCLKPYPSLFLDSSNEKDINLLLKAIDNVPCFSLLEKVLSGPDKLNMAGDTMHLLHWVLVNDPSLKSVPKSMFNEVLSLVQSELPAKRPDFIFKVKYSDHSMAFLKWQNYKRNYNTIYAYHGSRLENFYSIVNYGLQGSLTKTPLFGQGVYLSSELLVSLPYSPTGFGWGKSEMGAELSVVALCEVLDHPSTYCQVSGNKDRALANDSIAGEVPHKYYVVANSELIRIQYLLVYARTLPQPLESTLEVSEQANNYFNLLDWVKEHKLLTAIVGYTVLLASVGLSSNPQFLRYYRMLLKKTGIQ